VAWHKRNLFRKTGTQGKYGPWKRLTAAGIKMTHHATVAGHRENFIRKDWTRNQAEQETPKRREETVERPGVQQWLKELRTKSAATQKNGNKGSLHKTTAPS
jgi:hypothetical protein